MIKSINQLKYYIIFCLVFGCLSTPKVVFEDYVDTKTKPISFQKKRVFSFDESEVYFSNDFEGARLNNINQLNELNNDLSMFSPTNSKNIVCRLSLCQIKDLNRLLLPLIAADDRIIKIE